MSHNDQKDLLRRALDEAGLKEVVVSTANKLEGWAAHAAIFDHLSRHRIAVS